MSYKRKKEKKKKVPPNYKLNLQNKLGSLLIPEF